MAKNIHFDDVLQPSSLAVAPAKPHTKPLISNIRPSLLFSDWACPSLPPQQMVNQLPFLHLCLPNSRYTEAMQVVPSLSNYYTSSFTSHSSAELSAPTCSSNKTGDSSTLSLMEESLFKQKQPFEDYIDIRNESNDVDSALESEESESGWTACFDSSSDGEDDDEVESMRKAESEDSSVVSDASSGHVPHYVSSSKHQPLQKRFLDYEAPAAKLRRVGESKIQSEALEDTATSPLMQRCSSGMEGWQKDYKKIAKTASEQQLHNKFKARDALTYYIKR